MPDEPNPLTATGPAGTATKSPSASLSRRTIAVAGACAVLLLVVVAAAFALSSHEVVDRGRLVDGVDHDVLEVRLLDRFTVYADETVPDKGSDLLTAFGFLAIAGMAVLGFALAAAARPPDERLCVFYLLVAAGVTFLAFDEQFELIDSLGYNVEWLYVPDAVIYGPLVLLFAYAFRDILAASRPAMYLLLAGAALFALAQGIDRLPHDRLEGLEEKLEVIAVAPLGMGVAVLSVRHLRADVPISEPR